jgi:hypothetical protein
MSFDASQDNPSLTKKGRRSGVIVKEDGGEGYPPGVYGGLSNPYILIRIQDFLAFY